MLYIAYGSNMVQHQMDYRCPDARLVGIGALPGYTLEFYRHATIEPDLTGTSSVPVAVWNITGRDEASLDFYEGYPSYYGKEQRTVIMRDGSQIKGMVYIMRAQYKDGEPDSFYCEGIERAYADLGLDAEIETVLKPALKRCRDH